MSGAGWVATTVNYWWVLCAMMHVFRIWLNGIRENSIDNKSLILLIVLVLFAANHELSAILLICFSIIIAVVDYRKNHRYHLYTAIIQLFSLIEILFWVICPGNRNRFEAAVYEYFPNYKNICVSEKIYIGLLKVYYSFFVNNKWLFVVFAVVVALAVYECSKKLIDRILSCIGILICVPFLFPGLNEVFPKLDYFFISYENMYSVSWNEMRTYCLLLIWMMYLGIESYSILVISSQIGLTEVIKVLVVFFAGFCSNLVMGFSPTVYASGDRTSTFFYFCVLFATVRVSNYVKVRTTGIVGAVVASLAFFNCFSILARIID